MNGLSLRRSAIAIAILTTTMPGCARPNPAFGDDAGDGSAGSSGDDTTSQGGGTSGVTTGGGMSATGLDSTATADGGSESSPAPRCGDGMRDGDEACDDGDDGNSSEARCLPDCTRNVCGDGHVAPDQPCDDGNDNPDDGCDDCVPTGCGNFRVEVAEECDAGREGDARCTPFCTVAECGDGFTSPGEDCDDGNDVDDDGCSAACVVETCGDDIVQDGEACDGTPKDPPLCSDFAGGGRTPVLCGLDCEWFVARPDCCMAEGEPCIAGILCCDGLACDEDGFCTSDG